MQSNTLDTLVMVDVLGRIVFINNVDQLSDFNYREIGEIIGEPFSNVFNIDFEKFKQMVIQNNTPDDNSTSHLQLFNQDSVAVDIPYSTTSQQDINGNLMGYDILLRTSAVSVEQSHQDDTELDVVYDYAKVLIENIYLLLRNAGGNRLANHLEVSINKTIQLNAWSLTFKDGKLGQNGDFDRSALEAIITRVLLYAVNILGDKLVEKAVHRIQSHLTDDEVSLIPQVVI
jgi:hypothetical protein